MLVTSGVYVGITSGLSIPMSLDAKETLSDDQTVQKYGKKAPGSAVQYGAVLGYKFDDHFRADISLTNRVFGFNKKFKTDDPHGVEYEQTVTQRISSLSGMLTGYYDVKIDRFTPYVSLGVGFSRNNAGDYVAIDTGPASIKDTMGGNKSTSLNLAAGIGLTFAVNDKISLNAGYRFIDLGKMETSKILTSVRVGSAAAPSDNDADPIKTRLRSHEIAIGVSYYF